MNRILTRLVSLVLVCALIADPNVCVFANPLCMGAADPIPSSRGTEVLFQENALTLPVLSQRMSYTRSIISFWQKLKTYQPYLQQAIVGSATIAIVVSLLRSGGKGRYLELLYGSVVSMVTGGNIFPDGSDRAREAGTRLVAAAEKVEKILYQNRTLPGSAESYQDRCDKVVEKYIESAKAVGIEPDPTIVAAGKLVMTDDSERNTELRNLNVSNRDKQRLTDIIHRLNEGFRISYDPPDGVFDKNHSANPNQMGQYGKALESLDELLYVTARKLVSLQSPNTARHAKRMLYGEIKFVLAPMAYRLGMSSLSDSLWDEAFHTFEPRRYSKREADISRALKMNRAEAEQYITKTTHELESDNQLQKHLGRVSGRVKSPSSTLRKEEAKPKNYPEASFMRDLLGFLIILDGSLNLDNPDKLWPLLNLIGEHFAEMKNDVRPKKLPGYKGWDVTFYRRVNGIEIPHEFQIFENEAEYYRYRFGWPSAWWAYAIKQLTGVMPDFEVFVVKEDDLRGNFERFKEAIAHWTYCSLAVQQSLDLKHIPQRIPHPDSGKGNLADLAVLSGYFTPKLSGARVSRVRFDPDKVGYERMASSTGKNPSLDYVVEDGEVVQFTEGGRPPEAAYQKALKSVGSLRALVEISDRWHNDRGDLRLKGEVKLVEHFAKMLSKSSSQTRNRFMSIFPSVVRGETFRKEILRPLAIAQNFADETELLAALGYPNGRQLVPDKELLWEEIDRRTKSYGSKLLAEKGIPGAPGRTLSPLGKIAISEDFGLPDMTSLVFCVGAGLLTTERAAMTLKRSITFTSGGGDDFLKLDFDIREKGDNYEIRVSIDQDQPRTLCVLTDVFRKYDANLETGSSAYRHEGHPQDLFLIDKHSDHIQAIIDRFRNLKIPRTKTPFKPSRKVSLNLFLLDRPGAFSQLTAELEEIANIDTFDIALGVPGEYRWIDMEVELAELPNKSAYQELDDRLKKAVYRDAQSKENIPLIHSHDIIEQDISEATVDALLSLTRQKLNEIAKTDQPEGLMAVLSKIFTEKKHHAGGYVETHVLEYFVRALDLAEHFHPLKNLRDNRKDPFLVHPLGVARILMEDYEVRDEASLIEALTHDIKEAYIKERLNQKSFYHDLLTEQREQIASEEVDEQFAAAFPPFQHRHTEENNFLTYFGKRSEYDNTIQNLSERRAVNLVANKTGDRQHNLIDIFDRTEIDTRTGEYLFARWQIEKNLRTLLPLISLKRGQSSDPSIKRVYRNSRWHFLREFILKATDDRLPNFDYVVENGSREQNEKLVKTIDDFLVWMANNSDCIPTEWIGEKKMSEFIKRLQRLRTQLKARNQRGADVTEVDLSPVVLLNFPEGRLATSIDQTVQYLRISGPHWRLFIQMARAFSRRLSDLPALFDQNKQESFDLLVAQDFIDTRLKLFGALRALMFPGRNVIGALTPQEIVESLNNQILNILPLRTFLSQLGDLINTYDIPTKDKILKKKFEGMRSSFDRIDSAFVELRQSALRRSA